MRLWSLTVEIMVLHCLMMYMVIRYKYLRLISIINYILCCYALLILKLLLLLSHNMFQYNGKHCSERMKNWFLTLKTNI